MEPCLSRRRLSLGKRTTIIKYSVLRYTSQDHNLPHSHTSSAWGWGVCINRKVEWVEEGALFCFFNALPLDSLCSRLSKRALLGQATSTSDSRYRDSQAINSLLEMNPLNIISVPESSHQAHAGSLR